MKRGDEGEGDGNDRKRVYRGLTPTQRSQLFVKIILNLYRNQTTHAFSKKFLFIRERRNEEEEGKEKF